MLKELFVATELGIYCINVKTQGFNLLFDPKNNSRSEPNE